MLFAGSHDIKGHPYVDEHAANCCEDDIAIVGRQDVNQLWLYRHRWHTAEQ